jgi:hypothetical protein
LLNTGLGKKIVQNLATILEEHPTLKSLCGNKGDETELDMSAKLVEDPSSWRRFAINQNLSESGAVLLGPELTANTAIVTVDLTGNAIGKEQAQNLATILKEHATLKSLLGNKGDETELSFVGPEPPPQPYLDHINDGYGPGTSSCADFYRLDWQEQQWRKQREEAHKKDMAEWKAKYAACMEGTKPPLGDEGAIMLAAEMVKNKALTTLDIRRNHIKTEGGKAIGAALAECA